MDGVSRQIIIDAKKKYAKAHNINPNSLTEKQRKDIIRKIKQQFKEQFRERRNKYDEINKIKEQNIKLISEFNSAGLLEKGSRGYSKQTTFEFRLERLLKITKMILNDVQMDICNKAKNTPSVFQEELLQV